MKTDWKAFLEDAGAEFEAERVAHFGNPEREKRVSVSGLVFADLGYHGVIAVHGADAGSFLHAQLSNDIGRLDTGHSQLNAYCTPKGRMLGLMRVFRQGESYYLRLPKDTLEPVIQRLRRYVLHADVTLEDASENFLRIGVSGEDALGELLAMAGQVPEEGGVIHSGDLSILSVPGIQPRFEVYAGSLQSAQALWDGLNVHGAPVGESAWRLLEILAGMPSVFAATAELFVPQMANLQLVDGVNFKKGCYPGQEIVARMQYLGTLKRRMYLGRIDTAPAPLPGDSLFSATDSTQPVGRIVDAQPHPDGDIAALAILQIASADAGDVYLGASQGPVFRQHPLPYAFESQDV
ncbi:MAG TPA: folate-binding protein [Gammaproteobacteria bacterium]|nr:folate-binding protein [Gammaproteobacteria bacterium]